MTPRSPRDAAPEASARAPDPWQGLEAWGDRPAIHQGGEALSYAALAARADRFARRLPPERCLLELRAERSMATVVALCGALRAGHAVLLSSPGAPAAEEDGIAALAWRYDPATDALSRPEAEGAPRPTLHPDLCLLLGTSGSLARPRRVRLSWENVRRNADAVATYLGITPGDRAGLLLPLAYSYGLSVLTSHLARGACVHLDTPGPADADLEPFLRARRITSLAGVPHTFEVLATRGFPAAPLPDLRTLTVAGGHLAADLVRHFGRWAAAEGKRFFVMYGQTEATARMAFLPPERVLSHAGAIGGAIPGGTLRLRADDGSLIDEAGRTGRLVFEGPNVMLGYASAPDDLARGGGLSELDTGDLARFDDDGVFWLAGRRKRIAKVLGVRCDLDALERALGPGHAAVSDDERVFVLHEGANPSIGAARVGALLGIPEERVTALGVKTLPRTPQGKLDYAAAFALGKEQRSPPDEVAGGQDTLSRVRAVFAATLGVPTPRDDQSFIDLGGDSLRYIDTHRALSALLDRVPRGWEALSIADLAAPSPARGARATRIPADIALRALAILLVVVAHNGHVALGGSCLFLLVAGSNFTRFHLTGLLEGGRAAWRALAGFLARVLLPYWLLLAAFDVLHGGSRVSIYDYLLVENVVGGHSAAPFFTWFVQILVHGVLLCAAPLAVPWVRRRAREAPRVYVLGILALALGLALLDDRNALELQLRPTSRLLLPGFFPNERTGASLWIFALGVAAPLLRARAGRRVALAVAVLGAAALLPSDPVRAIATVGGMAALLFPWELRLPARGAPLVFALASASYAIYLVHLAGPVVGLRSPALRMLVGLAQGLALDGLWRSILRRARRSRRRERGAGSDVLA